MDSNDEITLDFRNQLMGFGIVSAQEQENLWDITQRCANTIGVPMGGKYMVAGAAVGVTIEGVGAIPGVVVGALFGLSAGTLQCVMLNAAVREQLRELARE